MEGFTYYYKGKKFKTIKEALEYHYTLPSEAHPLDIAYFGVVVGYIDINRLSCEVNRHESRG